MAACGEDHASLEDLPSFDLDLEDDELDPRHDERGARGPPTLGSAVAQQAELVRTQKIMMNAKAAMLRAALLCERTDTKLFNLVLEAREGAGAAGPSFKLLAPGDIERDNHHGHAGPGSRPADDARSAFHRSTCGSPTACSTTTASTVAKYYKRNLDDSDSISVSTVTCRDEPLCQDHSPSTMIARCCLEAPNLKGRRSSSTAIQRAELAVQRAEAAVHRADHRVLDRRGSASAAGHAYGPSSGSSGVRLQVDAWFNGADMCMAKPHLHHIAPGIVVVETHCVPSVALDDDGGLRLNLAWEVESATSELEATVTSISLDRDVTVLWPKSPNCT